jgi:hypothetical protein
MNEWMNGDEQLWKISSPEMTLNRIFQMVEDTVNTTWEQFHKYLCNSASKSGKGDGSSALLLKEITVKLMNVTKLYVFK